MSGHPDPKGSDIEAWGFLYGGATGIAAGVYTGTSVASGILGATSLGTTAYGGLYVASGQGIGGTFGYELGTRAGVATADALFNAQYATPTQLFGLPVCKK